jgi:hypothetical protein
MTDIPPELETELEHIYKTAPNYFKSEHVETHTHKDYIKQWYRNKEEKERKEKEERDIKVIMRQTDYNQEQAFESLKKNGSIEKCIEEYLGITKKKTDPPVSTNQAIYRSLREWLN